MASSALKDAAAPPPLFALEGAGKRYGDVIALDAVDLTIRPGERVALIGPSGSGKTTLLHLLARLVLPDRGRVLIKGVPAERLRQGPALARLVGLLPQRFDLVDALPVIHNVLAGRLGRWGFWRSALSLISPREAPLAQAALSRVGLEGRMAERTDHLSGGEQQRVALARLLVQDPEAFLADEPVASLDPARAEDLVAMLTQVAAEAGKTLVVSLHLPELALRHFPRIVALRRGRVLFDRPAGEVHSADLQRLYALEERHAPEPAHPHRA